MFVSDALQRSPVSDPARDNGTAEVVVPNDKFILNSINPQPSKGQQKAEKFRSTNLVRLLEIAKPDKEYQTLLKIIPNACLRQKEIPETYRELWQSLNRAADQNYCMTTLKAAGVYFTAPNCRMYWLDFFSFEIITDY